MAFVVKPNADYHWYVYDETRELWLNKNGQLEATDRVLKVYQDQNYEYLDLITDYKEATDLLGYSTYIGEFYIKEMECED